MNTPRRPHTTGRLNSRMTKTELAKLEQRLQAYALNIPQDFANFAEVELEIGMGNGLALLERAKANPSRLYVGSEIYRNGLRSLVYRLEQDKSIQNVRIVPEDARDVLTTLPKSSLNRVGIFYPDPWPKKRHHKRRLLQPELLTEIQPLLSEDGELWFVSDIPDYVFWTLSCAYQHGVFHPTAIGPAAWAAVPSWWVSTKYEQKAFREGRQAWYIKLLAKSE